MSEIRATLESAIQFVEEKITELQSIVQNSNAVGSVELLPCQCERCKASSLMEREPVPVSIEVLPLSENTKRILRKKNILTTTNILDTANQLFEDVENECAVLDIFEHSYRINKGAVLKYVEIFDDNQNNLLGDVLDLKMRSLSNFLLDRPDLVTPEILNHQNKIGDTPLITCIAAGMKDCLAKMLTFDYLNYDIPTFKGDNALMFALMKKDSDMASMLLRKVSDRSLFQKNDKDRMAIHMAVFSGFTEIATQIFDRMFCNEAVREEANAFLSSNMRNILLKISCQCENREIAIRLMNLPYELTNDHQVYVYALSYCYKYGIKDVAELILQEKNAVKYIRGENKLEENNILFALAKPEFADLVPTMVGMIDHSNPHLPFHFCHEMIVACSLKNPIFDWMVENYRIPTYDVKDPDGNSVYLHMAVNDQTAHFKTLYERESGVKPNFIDGKNAFHHAIIRQNHDLILFILEKTDSEKISQEHAKVDLMMHYQKLAVKNRSPKPILQAFEAKMREIRVFERMRREKETNDLNRLLAEMGEETVQPKAQKKKPMKPVPPPVVAPIIGVKREEKAKDTGVREMVQFYEKKIVTASPPKMEKKTPLPPPPSPKPVEKKAAPKKANEQKPVPVVLPPKVVEKKHVPPPVKKPESRPVETAPKREVVVNPVPAPPVLVEMERRDFKWDCENTDLEYLNDLARFILEPLGIF